MFQDPGYLGRSAGLTVHPVVFGWISAYSALVGIGLLLSKTRAAKRAGVLALVLGLVGIGQSGTRSGVLMLVAGFLIVQLGLRSMRRVSQFILLGLLAVAIGLSGVAGVVAARGRALVVAVVGGTAIVLRRRRSVRR